jgi:hypothetical protein
MSSPRKTRRLISAGHGRMPGAGGTGQQWRGDPGQGGAIRPELLLSEGIGVSPPLVGQREVTGMARQSQRTDGWPTILWIAWRAGETEHHEPLCRDHREYVFKHYPASAYGQGRRGERCSMCRGAATPNGPAPSLRACPMASGQPEATTPRGHGIRGSGRRVLPIRHSASSPDSGQE